MNYLSKWLQQKKTLTNDRRRAEYNRQYLIHLRKKHKKSNDNKNNNKEENNNETNNGNPGESMYNEQQNEKKADENNNKDHENTNTNKKSNSESANDNNDEIEDNLIVTLILESYDKHGFDARKIHNDLYSKLNGARYSIIIMVDGCWCSKHYGAIRVMIKIL